MESTLFKITRFNCAYGSIEDIKGGKLNKTKLNSADIRGYFKDFRKEELVAPNVLGIYQDLEVYSDNAAENTGLQNALRHYEGLFDILERSFLQMRFGKAAGRTVGSSFVPS